jgi:hypothetical protein
VVPAINASAPASIERLWVSISTVFYLWATSLCGGTRVRNGYARRGNFPRAAIKNSDGYLEPARLSCQFMRTVIVSPFFSIMRNRWPSAVTAYWSKPGLG